MKILVLLESPGKIKKISEILNGFKDGNKYTVKASMGHISRIEDSGKYKLGIDLSTYEPIYEILSDKKQVVKELKALVKENDIVYMASDDDREGEMISYSWIKFLDIPEKKQSRLLFHEITEKGVLEGIKNKGTLDEKMVEAAKARSELDKILGYILSPIAKHSVGAPSVGRVQSAALKIVADRENEIQKFIPEEYYEIYLPFTRSGNHYEAKYKGTEEKKITTFKSVDDAKKVVDDCEGKEYHVYDITSKSRNVLPKLPFTTSSFQQDVSAKLGYSPKRAMQIAQSLYEAGYITYMRTDSIRFSDEFIQDAKNKIIEKYGEDHYQGFPKDVKQSENAQEAHESIRPTHLEATPSKLSSNLKTDELKVYKLIYSRSLAALMKSAIIIDTTVTINNGKHLFAITGHQLKFDGFRAAYNYSDDDDSGELPSFKSSELINAQELEIRKKSTTPPGRYTEATLIKKLESEGIGRPSTYATVVETLKDREYMTVEKKSIVVTPLGLKLSAMLEKYFSDVINIQYTAEMETMLDEIATGKKQRKDELDSFYTKLAKTVSSAKKDMKENKPEAEIYDDVCPLCGKQLVIKTSKYGTKFVACSGYPKCKFSASLDENGVMVKETKPKAEITDVICPKCKKGHLVKRVAKATGEVFYGCSNFSKGCKFTMKEAEFNEQKGIKKESEEEPKKGRSTTKKKSSSKTSRTKKKVSKDKKKK